MSWVRFELKRGLDVRSSTVQGEIFKAVDELLNFCADFSSTLCCKFEQIRRLVL